MSHRKLSLYHLTLCVFLVLSFHVLSVSAQSGIRWASDGNSYYQIQKNELVKISLPGMESTTLLSKEQLTPTSATEPLKFTFFAFSPDEKKMLIFTNTKKVWRLNTRGDYWVFDREKNTITQLGKSLPASTLMFAKFSPDGKKVAYVSNFNIYVEDLTTSEITALTTDGSVNLINGTFDWAYEEEFMNRDGFRWSNDSQSISFWQLDASAIKKFYMINNTDSIYSQLIPLEYPKVGENPSSTRIGVINISTKNVSWMKIPGDPKQHYLVRMEYIPGKNELLVQQLNRKQNSSNLYLVNPVSGESKIIFTESDLAWVDIYEGGNAYAIDFTNKFIWLNNAKEILWTSEMGGWRQLYRIALDGSTSKLITKGNYDMIDLKLADEKSGFVYFMASPENATQKYLYRTKLNGSGKLEKITPNGLEGSHDYTISPSGKFATHRFSNHFTRPTTEWISLEKHQPLKKEESIESKLEKATEEKRVEFFKLTTEDNITVDGWMVKPSNFDPTKKYPIIFYVYSEPASSTVNDSYGVGKLGMYQGNILEDGYIYVSVDNRGTPSPKGREWRKSIYRKIGIVNIRDQAMAAKKILEWDFVDKDRVAVWGWSGGGSATLNLLFQHPDIYKTGISIAAVANQLTYDNIYQERYMGLPQENLQDFIDGSPLTYAKNLSGNLLYIHGTGDDNVHYQNAELLINELVKHNKIFQFMPYPNRAHGIYEGEGTSKHLATLFTHFLKTYCPPGAR